MDARRPLVPIFAGLSLLSSVSAPELSYILTAFVLALFGWKFWVFCNAVAWWSVWDFLVTSTTFARCSLAAAGVNSAVAWALASVTVGGGISLAVLVPSYLLAGHVKRRLLARFPGAARAAGVMGFT